MTSKNDLTVIDNLEKAIKRKDKSLDHIRGMLIAEQEKNVAYQKASFDYVSKLKAADDALADLQSKHDMLQTMLSTRDAQFIAQDNQIKGMISMARIYASGGKPI